MERTIKKISHHYILCGAGKNGHYVLEELIRTKRKVVAVEKDPKKVQALINQGIPTIEGDVSKMQCSITHFAASAPTPCIAINLPTNQTPTSPQITSADY